MLSVMSGVLKANIFDRITLVDNSETTEYGFSISFVEQYAVWKCQLTMLWACYCYCYCRYCYCCYEGGE